MSGVWWFLGMFLVVSSIDTYLYFKSGELEKDRRERFGWYMLPGSGFVAWFRRRRKA
jgi:hypothetical protein